MALAASDRVLLHVVTRGPSRCAPIDRLRERGWSVQRLTDPARVIRVLASHPDRAHAGLVDVRNGLDMAELAELGEALAARNAGWVAVLAPGQQEEPLVRQLVRDYCLDYVTLPGPESVLDTVAGHAHGMARMACEALPLAAYEPTLDGIVGRSAAMRDVTRTLRKAARTDAPVFIAGETGTGKELAARSLHRLSRRAEGPFVAINCGSIPHGLMQSELFGYERGAFTGAQARKAGRIEMANGGTLFLDEVGDLPLESQAALLRFLQESTVERLGGHQSVPVDVRIVSATHHDLEKAVAEGRFRADLYHRLCVLRLEQPPLRERGPDIDLLADHALARYIAEGQRSIRGFSRCARRAMHAYQWPGNVRELINRVRQAIVMSEGRLIRAADLNLDDARTGVPRTLDDVRETAVREALEQAVARNGGRQVDAARELGISRATLYRLLARYDLRADPVGEPDPARMQPDAEPSWPRNLPVGPRPSQVRRRA